MATNPYLLVRERIGDAVDDGFRVSPDVLRQSAGRVRQAAEAVAGLADQAAAACSLVAGTYSGWQLGTELDVLAGSWKRQLAQRGSAVAGDGARLDSSADTYAVVEGDNAYIARAAYPSAGEFRW